MRGLQVAEWSAEQLATKTRCRHCYCDILQTMPGGKWRDMPDESATCQGGPDGSVWRRHEPLPPDLGVCVDQPEGD